MTTVRTNKQHNVRKSLTTQFECSRGQRRPPSWLWRRPLAWLTACAVALGLAFAALSPVQAARTGEKEQQPQAQPEQKVDRATEYYNQGLALVEAGNFEKALDLFKKANKERDDDPEILNMLAFTQRKLGRLEQAFENYARALELRPEFPQAREYLGEAYLQAALEQVRILNGYGSSGEKELAQLRAAFEKAAWQLGVGAQPSRSGAPERKW